MSSILRLQKFRRQHFSTRVFDGHRLLVDDSSGVRWLRRDNGVCLCVDQSCPVMSRPELIHSITLLMADPLGIPLFYLTILFQRRRRLNPAYWARKDDPDAPAMTEEQAISIRDDDPKNGASPCRLAPLVTDP